MKKEEGKTGGRRLEDKREGRGEWTSKIKREKQKERRKRGDGTARAHVRSGLR